MSRKYLHEKCTYWHKADSSTYTQASHFPSGDLVSTGTVYKCKWEENIAEKINVGNVIVIAKTRVIIPIELVIGGAIAFGKHISTLQDVELDNTVTVHDIIGRKMIQGMSRRKRFYCYYL